VNSCSHNHLSPAPAKELLAEFWKLEKEAKKLLERLEAGKL